MLDKRRIAEQLAAVGDKLFEGRPDRSSFAFNEWQKILGDESFKARAEEAQSSFLVPSWEGNLTDSFKVKECSTGYTVVSTDGSQVYPDRHTLGANYFMVNTGSVVITYAARSEIKLFSEPQLLNSAQVVPEGDEGLYSPECVDLAREAYELDKLANIVESLEASSTVGLTDGTLIFWTLEGKAEKLKNHYLATYCASLARCHAAGVPVAGYISFPKSKELINLIKLGLCRFKVADCINCHKVYTTFPCKSADDLYDAMLLASWLPVGHRTIFFKSNSKITKNYPEHLQPYFVYLNVGPEIVRLEMPAYVVADSALYERVFAVAFDQSAKGRGYPVVLAEAHEQAVVRQADKDFFYSLMYKQGLEYRQRLVLSQKNLKKRGMGF